MVHDPVADSATVNRAYGVKLCDLSELSELSAVIVAVAHEDYASLGPDGIGNMMATDGIVVDVRSKLDPALLRPDLCYWSL
jgi:UDP-N-acetyl-D-galactosamine dehydrogenase